MGFHPANFGLIRPRVSWKHATDGQTDRQTPCLILAGAGHNYSGLAAQVHTVTVRAGGRTPRTIGRGASRMLA